MLENFSMLSMKQSKTTVDKEDYAMSMYDSLARTERPVLPWGWSTLRKIDREAARSRRGGTWDGFAKKVSPRTAQAAEKAYLSQLFGDNRGIDFGESLAMQLQELPELEPEAESRAEWEEKPALPPELFVFQSTCRDIAARIFDEAPRISITGTREANSSDTYDGGDIDEAPSALEQEADAENAEPDGERDGAEGVVDSINELHVSENWLRNAYSELLWSYDQLSSDMKNECNRLYRRLKLALLRQAREEGISLRPADFRCNREYLLDVEEAEMFAPRFRDDEQPSPKKSFVPKKEPSRESSTLAELLLCQLRQAKQK